MSKKNTGGAAHAPRRRIAAHTHMEPGSAPGTLIPLQGSAPAAISVLTHEGAGGIHRVDPITDISRLPFPADKGFRWVRVVGLGAVAPLQAIAERYGIRRLAMEDVLSMGGRSKLEEEGAFAFFLLQTAPGVSGARKSEHLSLFCRHGLIITFEAEPTALVNTLWERFAKEPLPGKVQNMAELASYMVLDLIIDGFYPHLDAKDEELAELEDCLNDRVPDHSALNRLHQVKRGLITLRRLLTPFRELRGLILRMHPAESLRELRPYYNDLSDHIVQVSELLDTYYEVAKSLDEISQSMLSNRMNDIMRILTIISTVFMPLSFIAGVYGMNFNTEYPLNMPELSSPYGYLFTLLLMAAIVLGMLVFFKRKKWF